jgi:hypothetical protein
MKLNEVQRFLLPVAYVLVSWLDSTQCQVIRAVCSPVAQQCHSVASQADQASSLRQGLQTQLHH